MSWKEIEKPINGRRDNVSVAVRPVSATSRLKLVVSIGDTVADRCHLGDDRVSVLYGDAGDAGKVRIVCNEAGGFSFSIHDERYRRRNLFLPLPPGCKTDRLPAQVVPFYECNGGLVIELPAGICRQGAEE